MVLVGRLGLGTHGCQQGLLDLDENELILRKCDAIKIVIPCGIEALVARPVALVPPVYTLVPAKITKLFNGTAT